MSVPRLSRRHASRAEHRPSPGAAPVNTGDDRRGFERGRYGKYQSRKKPPSHVGGVRARRKPETGSNAAKISRTFQAADQPKTKSSALRPAMVTPCSVRSEERRVGKECRSRGSP